MLKGIEKFIEWVLWESRLMLFLAVLSSIVSALILVVTGSYDVLLLLKDIPYAFGTKEAYEIFQKEAITLIISAIDAYLIATVLLIFGVGLYELFISKIDYIERDTRSSKILVIHSLDQLKDKLAKVIVMVLIVTFFKHAVNMKYEDTLNLLYLSIGIFLIALAIFFMHKGQEEKEEK